MPESTAHAVIKRLETRYLPLKANIEDVKTETLLGLVSTNARRVLERVSDEDIDRASLKDKAIAAGIYVDKRQLLSGQPTAILSWEERDHRDKLWDAVLREAQRRGYIVDVNPDTGKVRLLEEETH